MPSHDPALNMLTAVATDIVSKNFPGFISVRYSEIEERVVVQVTEEYFDRHYHTGVVIEVFGGITQKSAVFSQYGHAVMCVSPTQGVKDKCGT